MGLMYLFPVEEDQTDDRVQIKNESLTLKTYGLPMIFWGYLGAILVVVFAMYLGSMSVIQKMLTYNDPMLTFLAYLVRAVLIFGPVILMGFYFYEKFLIKKGNELIVAHRVFFIPVFKRKLILKTPQSLAVNHFMDSPNVAKLRNDENLRGFENKGYFELFAELENNKKVFIDRSSRKADLVKLQNLLSRY